LARLQFPDFRCLFGACLVLFAPAQDILALAVISLCDQLENVRITRKYFVHDPVVVRSSLARSGRPFERGYGPAYALVIIEFEASRRIHL
jgi:hypothetical protein